MRFKTIGAKSIHELVKQLNRYTDEQYFNSPQIVYHAASDYWYAIIDLALPMTQLVVEDEDDDMEETEYVNAA